MKSELDNSTAKVVATLIIGMLIAVSCYAVGSINALGIAFVYVLEGIIVLGVPYMIYQVIRDRMERKATHQWSDGQKPPEV